MHDNERDYRAVCFDLDGTLLPMDLQEFLGAYFKRIGAFAASQGLDPDRFIGALRVGVDAMLANAEGRTNEQVFWEAFAEDYGPEELAAMDVRAVCDDFYENDFDRIGDDVVPNPHVARAVGALKAKGYPLVLTTMPLFPRRAVEHRLEWAGLDPASFDRLTTYENSTSTKPHLAYYAENLDAMGLSGEDVLMVGNNTVEDLAFMQLGADAFLVTDWLLDPAGLDLDTVRHGTFEQFADWVEALPDCKNPARDIRK